MDEDSSTKQKTWQVCSFGKRNVFRLYLNEYREGRWIKNRKGAGTNSGESKCSKSKCTAIIMQQAS